jgi:hypothetical protein
MWHQYLLHNLREQGRQVQTEKQAGAMFKFPAVTSLSLPFRDDGPG